MKYKRSQIKKVTLKAQILRHMRKSCGLSAKEAGQRIGCSGPSIMHYENGRMEISGTKLEALVQAYGYTLLEFRALMANPPKTLNLKDECMKLLGTLGEHDLETLRLILIAMNAKVRS